MKVLNLYARQDVRFEDKPRPQIENDDDVIIQIHVAGICGSDISRFGKIGAYQPGTTWGHEFSGVVVEKGTAVTHVREGDKATACNCFPCFTCDQCQNGYYARCVSLEVLGGQRNGAFAEYIKVPARNVVPIPQEMDFATASFIEPSSVAVHGLKQVDVHAVSTVAIIGCGTIGLLALQWASIEGAAAVFAFDTDARKLKVASQVGAQHIFNPIDETSMARFMALTGGKGVDVVIESSGNAAGVASAMLLARKGGTVLLLGIPYGDVAFPRLNFEKIVRNELKVVGSWNSISAPFPGSEWQTSVDYLSNGRINIQPLITHMISLEEAPALFPQLYGREAFFVKVLMDVSGTHV